MKFLVYLCAYLTLAGTALAAQAQQPASNPIEQPATHERPKSEIADRPSANKKAPKGSEPSSTPSKQFVPKEKIPTDSAIAFPVDI